MEAHSLNAPTPPPYMDIFSFQSNVVNSASLKSTFYLLTLLRRSATRRTAAKDVNTRRRHAFLFTLQRFNPIKL